MEEAMSGLAQSKPSAWLAIALALAMSLFPVMLQAQGEPQAPTFKPEELEQLVAPIALYPDGLLAQVLMASTYPLEVVEAARFAKANPKLKEEALDKALQQQSWDPSVKSLLSFPQVLEMMDQKLDWTQKLGDAFLAQQKDVMDAVQRLRTKAQAEGNLKSNEQQTVTVEEQPPASGSQVIVIQPANPQVVYVPTYNPTVVYGAWPYPAYPPAYYYPPGYVATAAFVSFGVGMAVGAAYWGGCNWGHGDVDINTNRYNNFNQNVTQNYNRSDVKNKVEGGKWQHNPEHRKGVEYRDRGTQDRFGRGQSGNASTRDAYRGRAEQGRQQIAREGAGNMQNQIGQGGRGGNGPGSQRPGSQRPTASTRPAGGAGGGPGSQRPSAGTREAGGGRGAGDRGSSAFGGSGSGAQARRDSDRGRTSRESAASTGSRGGGGQRSGGYGGSGGRAGGGSRGGGGRGGGGRR
jgi:hypothetical protein